MQASDFRNGSSPARPQAGSAVQNIMKSAKNMALDGPLGAEQERLGRDSSWRRKTGSADRDG
jgi:hypothetical protein